MRVLARGTSDNTLLPRRGLRPLATAGDEIGLVGNAVDSPSPPLRSAPGPSANAKRYRSREQEGGNGNANATGEAKRTGAGEEWERWVGQAGLDDQAFAELGTTDTLSP